MNTTFNTIDTAISSLYKCSEKAHLRYNELKSEFNKAFGMDSGPCYAFSAPGRIEICGNHTDHQGGKVLTAAIECDLLGLTAKSLSNKVHIHSVGQRSFTVDLDVLTPQQHERGKSAAMVRGIAAGIALSGGKIGGFNICISSNVPTGSGISSSAAFETLIATVFNHLYNDGNLSAYELAQISRNAEADFFGKPCGLMDQMASAHGGCIAIDFSESTPIVTAADMSCITDIYDIVLVHPEGSHSNLGRSYSDIVNEMVSVAECFGSKRLADVSECEFMTHLDNVRKKTSDRAVLRAMHYYAETARVEKAIAALSSRDADEFIRIINASGDSSSLQLQNVYLEHMRNKSISLALSLTKKYLADNSANGACRIHGGGFLGTIIAFMPKRHTDDYMHFINSAFNAKISDVTKIRSYGGIALSEIN